MSSKVNGSESNHQLKANQDLHIKSVQQQQIASPNKVDHKQINIIIEQPNPEVAGDIQKNVKTPKLIQFQESQLANEGVQQAVEEKQTQFEEQQVNIPIQQNEPIEYQVPKNEQDREVYTECSFCAELLKQQQFKSVFECEHLFCKNCLTLYVENEVKNFRIIQCPMQECRKNIKESETFSNDLMKPHKQKYDIIKFRKNIEEQKNLMLCPNQICKKGYMQIKQGYDTSKCVQCQKIYCINCKMESHEGKCQNYEEILLKDKFKYKRCYGCKRIVQRNQGCPHMRCKCGAQFCYYCGGAWNLPHYCLRYLAGGELLTDTLNQRLKCLRIQKLEYDYSFIGYTTRIPYYLVCFLILTIYAAWCVAVLAAMLSIIIAISAAIGYFIMICYGCKQLSGTMKCIFVIFSVVLLPLAFVVGIAFTIGLTMYKVFPKYLQLALSAKLFPCFIC